MKLKAFLLFAVFALPHLAQSNNQHVNSTIYYLLLSDISGGKPDHHLLNDPAKVKAAKIRKMEAIKGKEYAVGSSATDEKGIKAFDRREIIEFDKNGNPVKYSYYNYSWGGSFTEMIFTYNQNGDIAGASVSSKDTTGKKVTWSGKYKFKTESVRLTGITWEDDPGGKRSPLYDKYEFSYRSDGTLEKVFAGKNKILKIRCDEKGRVSVFISFNMSYLYNYDLKGVINAERYFDTDEETEWGMNYEFDPKGNLLSITSGDENNFEQKIYTPGKDGFPASARYIEQGNESRIGANLEFRYTKW